MAGFTDPSQCAAARLEPNTTANPLAIAPFIPLLGCYDLTRPVLSSSDNCPAFSSSTLYPFRGHTDVEDPALYIQDQITYGNWSVNLGIRGDLYNGLVTASQAEPRLGLAYNIKRSSTVLRVSYARTLETPFNENLVLASEGCNVTVIENLFLACPPAIRPAIEMSFMRVSSRPSGSMRW